MSGTAYGRHKKTSDVIKDFVFKDKAKAKDIKPQKRGRGQGLGTENKAKDKHLEPRPKPKKLKAKIKNIQMPLLQRHITVNWGDFNKIWNIIGLLL